MGFWAFRRRLNTQRCCCCVGMAVCCKIVTWISLVQFTACLSLWLINSCSSQPRTTRHIWHDTHTSDIMLQLTNNNNPQKNIPQKSKSETRISVWVWAEVHISHILCLLSICFSVQKHKSFTSNKDILWWKCSGIFITQWRFLNLTLHLQLGQFLKETQQIFSLNIVYLNPFQQNMFLYDNLLTRLY